MVISGFHREAQGIEEAELAEAFEIYLLPGDVIPGAASNGYDLFSLLHRTGFWHHLVRSAGRPLGIAQSGAAGSAGDQWSLESFFLSSLAAKISNAVTTLDAERPDDSTEAMFVTVPYYNVDFFLLRTGAATEVYVVSAPIGNPDLIEGHFYAQEELLQKLQATPPRQGLITPRSQ
jgi:hypothetical protein